MSVTTNLAHPNSSLSSSPSSSFPVSISPREKVVRPSSLPTRSPSQTVLSLVSSQPITTSAVIFALTHTEDESHLQRKEDCDFACTFSSPFAEPPSPALTPERLERTIDRVVLTPLGPKHTPERELFLSEGKETASSARIPVHTSLVSSLTGPRSSSPT